MRLLHALLTACLEEGHFDRERLARQAQRTDTTATELADELTRLHGLSFQAAHRLAAALVQRLCREGRVLQEATPQDLLELGGPELSAEALQGALDPAAFVRRRSGYGGPAPERVAEQLERARHLLEENLVRLAQHQNRLAEVRRTLAGTAKERV